MVSLEDLGKCQRVLESCQTKAQFECAMKYANLLKLKHSNPVLLDGFIKVVLCKIRLDCLNKGVGVQLTMLKAIEEELL